MSNIDANYVQNSHQGTILDKNHLNWLPFELTKLIFLIGTHVPFSKMEGVFSWLVYEPLAR